MRDESHADQVERWARHVKTHPRSEWIKDIKPLIDSQITIANRFYTRLAHTPNGKEKIQRLRGHTSTSQD